MIFYSTENKNNKVTLSQAVIQGLADDKGLFMPEKIKALPASFFENISSMSFQEMAFEVAKNFFGEDIPEEALKDIVYDTLSFDTPLVKVNENIHSLELFHGPTLAFKDVGGRFMARILRYLLNEEKENVNVLVATSGDTGSAVANGFYEVDGIKVFVLYPKGKVSNLQEKQFTTLGQNITALEIDGTFDDCQALVKEAFMDQDLKSRHKLTSANSINVARFLPQAFYYFHAWAQLSAEEKAKEVVVSVPSGNLGNITAGIIAQQMGLPIHRFIAANNENDVVYEYIQTGEYKPRRSVETIANAMDVGAPSNFARVLDLYQHDHKKITAILEGARYSDQEIREIILRVAKDHNYICDPHGATGFASLETALKEDQVGIFLETAHPAKFNETMEDILGDIEIPEKLKAFLNKEKKSIALSNQYNDFKTLIDQIAF
ncbi:threonine synthase [Halosquirtibacter xylanolyticus]|uniref:threonine synthase n=1 Tax=Halosquirtibacter xylanolyticus TaxID=3374599 RepID=UPI003748827E|nr:threonine synthase [Prolixibacteraceae bacterium]